MRYRLGDVCSRLSSGKTISASAVADAGLYPVYGANGLRGYTNSSNFKGQCALIGRQGAYCGNVKYFSGEGYITEHAVVLQANGLADTQYLAYRLSILDLGRLSGQSAQPGLSVKDLSNQIVDLPSLDVQRSVANLLSALDRKIALNRRKIATLEKMAKEIYDYWFVQYDFPDANGRPYKSSGGEMVYSPELKREIPKGWNVVKLSRMANFLFGYPFDSSRFNSNGDGRRIVRIRNVKDGYSNDFTTEEAPSEYIIRNGDLLIGMDGYFDMNIWVGGDAYLVQRSCRVKAKDSVYQGYVRRFIAPPIKQLEKALLGATVAHLGKTHLDDIDVIVPPKDMRVFLMLNDLDASIVQQGLEVAKLSSLRDFLLPLLMNGQVKVGELYGAD